MNRFERKFVEKTYYNIKDGATPLPFLFTIMERYLRKPLTPEQRALVTEQTEKIRSGEMSFEEYLEYCEEQRAKIRII